MASTILGRYIMMSPGTLLQYDYNVNEIRLCLSENYYLWITYPGFPMPVACAYIAQDCWVRG